MSRLKRLKAAGYDLEFLTDTQPIGNVKCKDTALQVGSMWTASLYIYKLIEDPGELWLLPLSYINDELITIDVGTQDAENIAMELDKAVVQAYRTVQNEKGSMREVELERYHALKDLATSVRKQMDIMKFIKIRFHVSAETQDALEKKILDIRKKLQLERYGVTLCLMEQKEEFQSRFIDYITQNYLPNKRVGLDIASTEFGHSLPMNFVYLHDKRGDYLGQTKTQGQFIFDRFELDGTHRTHYNIAVFGKMGVGKSTLLKKLFQDDARKGYLIYGFDKSGEYTSLIKHYNGKIIRLDGQEGRINLFEILPLVTGEDESTGDFYIDEQACYTSHISRLATWFSMIYRNPPQTDIEEFKGLLSDFYRHYQFVDENGNITRERVTDLGVEAYPILADFVNYISKLKPVNKLQEESWHKIYMLLKNLLVNHGTLFNGATQIQSLSNEQILFFNIEGLASVSQEIANAQIFSATTMFYAMQIMNGKEQMRLYKEKKIGWDFLRRSSLYIDECHNLLNINNLPLVEFMTTFMREARKMLISIVLSTQSISELVSESHSNEQRAALQKVFEFCQYVCYFNIKSNMLPLLKIISSGQLTNHQIDNIGKFKQGEFLISFDGNQAFEVKMDVTKEELTLFDGGGRTHD